MKMGRILRLRKTLHLWVALLEVVGALPVFAQEIINSENGKQEARIK
jgi:hypothetical protein